jgi:hypothetical protein
MSKKGNNMNAPTEEQIAKLPKWAQDHIANVERERFVSVRALNEAMDSQTKAAFYCDDYVCTGERGIHISWNEENYAIGKVALVPQAYQKISLIAKGNL